MRNQPGFFGELLRQPVWVITCVLFLMVVNLASAGFRDVPVAKLVFIICVIPAILIMGLYSRYGFEMILGMGHVLWIPLLIPVLMEIPAAGGTSRG